MKQDITVVLTCVIGFLCFVIIGLINNRQEKSQEIITITKTVYLPTPTPTQITIPTPTPTQITIPTKSLVKSQKDIDYTRNNFLPPEKKVYSTSKPVSYNKKHTNPYRQPVKYANPYRQPIIYATPYSQPVYFQQSNIEARRVAIAQQLRMESRWIADSIPRGNPRRRARQW